MSKKPKNSQLPDNYQKLFHADNLSRDRLNVRDRTPPDTLIDSIRKTGLKEPLIVREDPENNDEYLITDGWQRYQSMVYELNWSHVPCDIHDKFFAFRETERATERTPFTEYEKIRHHGMWFTEEMNDNDITENEAIEKIEANSSVPKSTIRKRVRIFQLPDKIHAFLKAPENRKSPLKLTAKHGIRESDGALYVYAAQKIAKAYHNNVFDSKRAIEVAAESLKRTDKQVIEKGISECKTNPDSDVKEIFEEVVDRYKNPNRSQQAISAGTVYLGKDAETIHKYCIEERVDLNKVVKEALEEKAESLKEEYEYLNKVEI